MSLCGCVSAFMFTKFLGWSGYVQSIKDTVAGLKFLVQT